MVSFKDKFKYATRGLLLGCKDISIRIQLVLGVLACIAAFVLQFTLMEWCVLLVCIGMVLVAEGINTVIERMMDFVHPDKHDKVRDIKDMAAGFVLVASLIAFVVGCILIGGKLW